MKSELTTEGLKATPPIVGAALTMNEWIAIGTGVYIVIQALYLLRKWWREEKDWKRGRT